MAEKPQRQGRTAFAWQLCCVLLATGWLLFSILFFVEVFVLRRWATTEIATVDQGSNRAALHNSRVLKNVQPDRLHGVVGVLPDGSPAWVPAPPTPDDVDMPVLLHRGGGFNLKLSDTVPLDRTIPDRRARACRAVQYDDRSLCAASVVIVFFNEPFSTLMRSVHSVLNLTPPALLQQVVLVDDGSDLEWIRADGNGEFARYVEVLKSVAEVTVVRLPVRKGIVGARMAGIRASTAPIFVILDSHVEVQPGWLEPLVARIKEDPSRVVMPQVDGLNPETLTHEHGGIGCTLGFLWKLIEHGFTPDAKSPASRRGSKATDFVDSPTMAGGLFAANKEFFFQLGGYDEQFSYWGTENLELSFRVWMCGGQLECSGCSRVYHIFRKGGVGYSSPSNAITKNKMRLLTIWMDQFADLAWRVIGSPRLDFGPYDEDKKWRQQRNCKSFEWFLNTVNPEADVREVPRDVPYLGELQNIGVQKCLDTQGQDTPGSYVILYQCTGRHSQQFMFFRRPQHIMPVSNDESCFGHNGVADMTGWCAPEEQRWTIVPVDPVEDKKVYLLQSLPSEKCLTASGAKLELMNCVKSDKQQMWTWPLYDPPKNFTPPPPAVFRGQQMAQ